MQTLNTTSVPEFTDLVTKQYVDFIFTRGVPTFDREYELYNAKRRVQYAREDARARIINGLLGIALVALFIVAVIHF